MRAAASIALDLLIGVPIVCVCLAIELHKARAAARSPLAGAGEWQ